MQTMSGQPFWHSVCEDGTHNNPIPVCSQERSQCLKRTQAKVRGGRHPATAIATPPPDIRRTSSPDPVRGSAPSTASDTTIGTGIAIVSVALCVACWCAKTMGYTSLNLCRCATTMKYNAANPSKFQLYFSYQRYILHVGHILFDCVYL